MTALGSFTAFYALLGVFGCVEARLNTSKSAYKCTQAPETAQHTPKALLGSFRRAYSAQTAALCLLLHRLRGRSDNS
eukprot:12934202-Alexandrium_andersonii.AAC.1